MHSHLLLASAGAAVSLMSLATTEQVALKQGVGTRVRVGEHSSSRVSSSRSQSHGTREGLGLGLLPMNHVDTRRLKVDADGLSFFHIAPVAADTTVVSPLRRDGTPHVR